MKKLTIAIDGPVGSGKSSVARRVAALLGFVYLDSGAMYRALAWKALERGVTFEREADLESLARNTRIDLEACASPAVEGAAPKMRVRVDGVDVTERIRTAAVSQAASKVAAVAGVRRVLVAEQQRAGREGGVVMEGRDIGTVVFPNAELKIFLEASLDVRAERRWREHQERGDTMTLEEVMREVRERDRRDRERNVSPLVRAADAVQVDNTAMGIEETARLIVLLAREKAAAESRRSGTSSTTHS
ncbi:MAG TPA: (d)CMP kinase [Candidatus Acidoferrales bacterium]|nr:(d)CMP kinase [Candidatus Acidoferrales bacterium]